MSSTLVLQCSTKWAMKTHMLGADPITSQFHLYFSSSNQTHFTRQKLLAWCRFVADSLSGSCRHWIMLPLSCNFFLRWKVPILSAQTSWGVLATETKITLIKGAMSLIENFSQNFSSSSFVIRFNHISSLSCLFYCFFFSYFLHW